MKAIVLTYDKYISITNHMIYTYQKYWTSNPFQFRVPYQTYPEFLKKKYGEKIELIKAPKAIKDTALRLLEDISDNEWIYWCMDDKYLIAIEEKEANQVYKFVSQIDDPTICGISFCKCRKHLKDEYLNSSNKIVDYKGQTFVERIDYSHIWIHQFARAKIFKELFESFPNRPFVAREMDKFKDGIKTTRDKKLYVSEKNLVVFGESTLGGKITKNCLESFQSLKLNPPKSFEITERVITMGKLPKYYSFLGVKFSLPDYLKRSYWKVKFQKFIE